VEVRMHEVAREGEGGALSTVLTPRWRAKMS
jgi:hypothetical protein